MNDVQVIGDKIYFHGVEVARLNEKATPSLLDLFKRRLEGKQP